MSANPSHLSDPPPPAALVRSRKHRGNLGRPGLGALRGWVARKRRRIGQAGEGASPQSMARMQRRALVRFPRVLLYGLLAKCEVQENRGLIGAV